MVRLLRLPADRIVSFVCTGLLLGAASCSGNGGIAPSKDSGVDAQIKPDAIVDSAPPPCVLAITQINGRAVATVATLGAADDKDSEAPGIQVDVVVGGENLPEGGDLFLTVSALADDPSAVVSSGTATFAGVTLRASLMEALFEAHGGTCKGAKKTVSVVPSPECYFIAPVANATLGKADDKDPSNATFDFDIVVGTYNAEGGSVTLSVNALNVGTEAVVTAGAAGTATFANVVLPGGADVPLSAELTAPGKAPVTCTQTISVVADLPICNLVLSPAPTVPLSGGNALGVGQDAATDRAGIQNTITVETQPWVDKVTLLVDDGQVGQSAVQASQSAASGAIAVFEKQDLADGAREIRALCADVDSGNVGESQSVTLSVDATVPAEVTNFSCRITQARTGSVTCTWTPVGADVMQYEIRYRAGAAGGPLLAVDDWASAVSAATLDVVPPDGASKHVVKLDNLPLGRTYYFGIRARDDVGNESPSLSALAGLPIEYNSRVVTGIDAGSRWGAIMSAGDFNCDGFTDLAVGDPSANAGAGRVSIYTGNANGYRANPDFSITGTRAGGRFGSALATLKDFDGDWWSNPTHTGPVCNDLAVSAAGGPGAPSAVFVYIGRKVLFDRTDLAPGTSVTPGAEGMYRLPPAAGAGEQLGEAIAGIGDFDGDGLGDLAVSHRDVGAADSAQVYVVRGSQVLHIVAGRLTAEREIGPSSSFAFKGGSATARFGLALAGGDLDADGKADLIIGAQGISDAGTARGAVYVVKGGASTKVLQTLDVGVSDRVFTIAGGSGNGALGERVAFVGDMDGDGSAEFAASDTSVATGAGAVYVFSLAGKTAPATLGVDKATMAITNPNAQGNASSDQFGISLAVSSTKATENDLDGDGLADLLVGAASIGGTTQGGVYGFRGRKTLASVTVAGKDDFFAAPAASVSFGVNVIWAHDVNQDGLHDLIVADPGFVKPASSDTERGRAIVFF